MYDKLEKMYKRYLEGFDPELETDPCDNCDEEDCKKHCDKKNQYETQQPMSYGEFCDGYLDYITSDDERY